MAKTFGVLIALLAVGALFWAVFGGNVRWQRPSGSPATMSQPINKLKPLIMPAIDSNDPVVVFHTNFGDITLELFKNQAPQTVANFLKLTRAKFYDGTMFHRVIKGFMIQGGDPLTKTEPKNWAIHGTGGPGYQFADEPNEVRLVRGVLAMANAGPDTNGSQFFIITAPVTDWLQGKHTAFGRVLTGMEVVDKIEAVKVNENAHPLEDVLVATVEIQK